MDAVPMDPRLQALVERSFGSVADGVVVTKEVITLVAQYKGAAVMSVAVFNALKGNEEDSPLLRTVAEGDAISEWEKLLTKVFVKYPTATVLDAPQVRLNGA